MFRWSRRKPGALQAGLPGRGFRLGVVAALFGFWALASFVAGPSQFLLIGIVLCVPAVALIVPELFALWEWYLEKSRELAYRTDERIYRFGYAQIRMLMDGPDPWFAAADIVRALGLENLEAEIRSYDAAKCRKLGKGGDLYLSGAAVQALGERSRHPDARSFRLWFTREVMFPFTSAGKKGE